MAAARLRGSDPGVTIDDAAALAAARAEEAGFVVAAASLWCRSSLADAAADDGGALKRLPAPKAVAEGEGSVAAVFLERGGGEKRVIFFLPMFFCFFAPLLSPASSSLSFASIPLNSNAKAPQKPPKTHLSVRERS